MILAGLFLVPLHHIEIANLEPVEAVWIYKEGDKVVLLTDTEDKGVGVNVEYALIDMRHKSSGVIYLDTAQYVFVAESAENEINNLRNYVKNSVWLCKWNGEGSFKNALKYANAHNVGIKINEWITTGNLPELPTLIQQK